MIFSRVFRNRAEKQIKGIQILIQNSLLPRSPSFQLFASRLSVSDNPSQSNKLFFEASSDS